MEEEEEGGREGVVMVEPETDSLGLSSSGCYGPFRARCFKARDLGDEFLKGVIDILLSEGRAFGERAFEEEGHILAFFKGNLLRLPFLFHLTADQHHRESSIAIQIRTRSADVALQQLELLQGGTRGAIVKEKKSVRSSNGLRNINLANV